MARFVANDADDRWPSKKKKSETKSVKMFKQGTVVRVRPGSGYRSYEGVNAVVLDHTFPDKVLVQFEREMDRLHAGEGKGAERRCWFFTSRDIMPYYGEEVAARQSEMTATFDESELFEPIKKKKKRLWNAGQAVRVLPGNGWDQYLSIDAIVLDHNVEEENVLIQFAIERLELHDGDGAGAPNRCLYVGEDQIRHYFEASEIQAPKTPPYVSGGEEASDGDGESAPNWQHGIIERHGHGTVEEIETVSDASREYFKKKTLERDLNMALGEEQDAQPEPEEELEEEVEESQGYSGRQNQIAQQYRKVGLNAYSTGKTVAVKQKKILREGHLCRVQKANGDRTMYDTMAAVIVGEGKFGRFLLQFDQKVRGGHDGKGLGEPGRCKWFYKRDVVSISMGEAIEMGKPNKPKKSTRPKLSTSIRHDDRVAWKPSSGLQPSQDSGSMWDVEEVPAIKKGKKKPVTPTFTTFGKMGRGSRVVVHAPPSDNKALRGQQGTVISNEPHNSNVTVQFDKSIPGCHDANGTGKSGHCWNLHKMFLKALDTDIVFFVKGNYERGKKNLKGMEVKVLANITGGFPAGENLSVVEFVEEIPQGHSADGRGKKAHCLSIPTSLIGKRKKREKKTIKKPHEVKAEKEAKKK